MTIKTYIELDRLVLDPRAQPRLHMDLDTVTEYAERMQADDEFPPVVVFDDDHVLWVVDGFHRVEAAKRAELKRMLCELHKGDFQDAVWYSLGANKQHGLPRTNEDKRAAVLKALQDELHGRQSSRAIALHVGVHPSTVDKIRAEVTAGVRQLHDVPGDPVTHDLPETRVGLDGKTRRVKVRSEEAETADAADVAEAEPKPTLKAVPRLKSLTPTVDPAETDRLLAALQHVESDAAALHKSTILAIELIKSLKLKDMYGLGFEHIAAKLPLVLGSCGELHALMK